MSYYDRAADREVLDRVRRIETRVTVISKTLGIETPTDKPQWVPNQSADPALPSVILIPSAGTALNAILAVIPYGYAGSVLVRLGDEKTGRIICQLVL